MLENVKIARPCGADWNAMTGDERVRFCQLCQLNVYNLSGMKREEAEALLAGKEGKVCVRLYKRADGTVLTQDCPVGLAAVRRRIASLVAAGAALVAVAWAGFARGSDEVDGPTVEPVSHPVRVVKDDVVMGRMAPPTRTPTPTPPPAPDQPRAVMGEVQAR